MGTSYNCNIATDGLVLCLDAANPRSYPLSGTSWNDLSGNSYNGTLTNGPSFSSDNAGTLVFDGTNDYINLSSLIIDSYPGTISIWAKITGNDEYVFSAVTNSVNRYYILYNSSNQLHYVRGTSYSPLVVASNLSSNRYYYMSMAYTNNTLYGYLNGEYVGSHSYVNGGSWVQNAKVGGFYTGTQNFLTGNIGMITIHDRVLSANEVKQNFNATRGRYGI